MGVKITTLVTDARRVGFALKAIDIATRARLRVAVQETTEAVAARSRANVPVSTPASRKAKSRPGPGELRDTIRTAYGVTGLTGYVLVGFGKLPRRSRSRLPTKQGPLRLAAFQKQQRRLALQAQNELGVYAMVINYGSPGRGIKATRFIDRAKEAERTAHVSRIQNALAQSASAAAQGAAA